MRALKRRSSQKTQDEEALPRSVAHTAKLRRRKQGFEKPGEARKFAKTKHLGSEKASLTETASSGEFYEEQIDDGVESQEAEGIPYREPAMYDSLLKKLGSDNVYVADALRRRQREDQGETETDEDADCDLESICESEEKDDGNDNDSPRSYIIGNDTNCGMELSEDVGTDDDDAMVDTDTDEESASKANYQPLPEAFSIISDFDSHFSHRLASTEVVCLSERKWRYTWKMPPLNMSNWYWRGTGACFIKDLETKSYCGLKPRLYKHWLESYKASGGSEFHQSRQSIFFLSAPAIMI